MAEELAKDHPRLKLIWADGGYTGRLVTWAKEVLDVVIDIVRKREGQRGFEVLPRRWVVERTFAWIMKCRRLAADHEGKTEHAKAMVTWAMVGLMTRRLARHTPGHTVTTYNWS